MNAELKLIKCCQDLAYNYGRVVPRSIVVKTIKYWLFEGGGGLRVTGTDTDMEYPAVTLKNLRPGPYLRCISCFHKHIVL